MFEASMAMEGGEMVKRRFLVVSLAASFSGRGGFDVALQKQQMVRVPRLN